MFNQTFSSKTKTSQFSVSQHKCKHSTCEPTSTVTKNFAPSFRDSSVRIIMSFFTSNLTAYEKKMAREKYSHSIKINFHR